MSKHNEDATNCRQASENTERELPEGWYYYGKQPPWAAAPARQEDTTSDLKQAFDSLANGKVDADTVGRLFALDDRHFWKGALVGAGVVLAMSNLPTIKAFMALAMAGAGDMVRHAAPRKEAQQQHPDAEEKQS